MYADTVLKALGVDTDEDIERLLGYFFSSTTDGEGSDDGLADVEDGEDQDITLGLKVRPDDVVRVIRQFVEDREAMRADEVGVDSSATAKGIATEEKAASAARNASSGSAWPTSSRPRRCGSGRRWSGP